MIRTVCVQDVVDLQKVKVAAAVGPFHSHAVRHWLEGKEARGRRGRGAVLAREQGPVLAVLVLDHDGTVGLLCAEKTSTFASSLFL